MKILTFNVGWFYLLVFDKYKKKDVYHSKAHSSSLNLYYFLQ